MKVFILLAFLGAAAAVCPNKCSGHGTCGGSDRCSCFPNWQGADCSARTCAFGLSWITAADSSSAPAGLGLGGRHAYTECSSKGTCDRGSGICKCFDGYEGKGCRRTSCPNSCSGHGRCVYNRDVHSQSIGGLSASSNGYDGYNLQEFTTGFDAGKTQQCMCDRGWEDVDCSARICPKGDDPLTNCDSKNQKDDVQLILFRGADEFDLQNNAQFFTLTFTDMFNGNYTTYPIQLNQHGKPTGGALCTTIAGAAGEADCFSGTDTAITNALKALPNFAIPSVHVQYQNMTLYRDNAGTAAMTVAQAEAGTPDQFANDGDTGDTMDSGTTGVADVITGFLVTFTDSATSGYQNSLDCYVGSQYDSDEPASQPRFGLGGGSLGITCDVYHVGEPENNDPDRVNAAGASDAPGWLGSLAQQANVAANRASSTSALGTGGAVAPTSGTAATTYGYSNSLLNDLVPYDSLSSYKEHTACSGRGACDSSSGLCECYDGFTGESCDTQHAFF